MSRAVHNEHYPVGRSENIVHGFRFFQVSTLPSDCEILRMSRERISRACIDVFLRLRESEGTTLRSAFTRWPIEVLEENEVT